MDREALAGLTLIEFVHALSPEMREPWHLQKLADVFERIAKGEPVRALCSYPIRHWKTTLMLHAVVWLLCKDPSRCLVLMSHDHSRAEQLGKKVIQLADRAGVGGERGTKTIRQWFNRWNGGVTVMSSDQSSLGCDVHGLFFDDPINEADAYIPQRREEIDEAIAHYTVRCMRGGEPGPVVGVMSRWHPRDPVGVRLERAEADWEYIHQPAVTIDDDGNERAFAPDVWDLPALKKIRAEEYERDPTERIWMAQFQGEPRVIGGAKFQTPALYTSLPDYSYRLGFGVDLAATTGEGSDYFALVVGKVMANKLYVLEMQRTKLEPHLIESVCKAVTATYGRGNFFTYVSGPEIGMVKIMRERGIPFMPMRARYNKLVRAERTIRRYNDGGVVLPQGAPWLGGWLARAEMFTGQDKGHDDDEIDALVSLNDGLMGSAVGSGFKTVGRAYPGFNG